MLSIPSFAPNVFHTVLLPLQNSDYVMVWQINAILSAKDYLFDVSVGHSYGVHLIYTDIYKMLHSTEVSVDLPVLPWMYNASTALERDLWRALVNAVMNFVNNQLDAQFFFMYVCFYSLYVSGSHAPIIRRINCINTTSGICHSV